MAIFFNDADGRAGIEQFRYVSDIVSDIDPALDAELEIYGGFVASTWARLARVFFFWGQKL